MNAQLNNIEDITATQALAIIGTDTVDVMNALDATDLEAEQNWDLGRTTYTFADGSKVVVDEGGAWAHDALDEETVFNMAEYVFGSYRAEVELVSVENDGEEDYIFYRDEDGVDCYILVSVVVEEYCGQRSDAMDHAQIAD